VALLVLRGHETEICYRCGRGVDVVWHAPDELFWRVNGSDVGCLCVGCFDLMAEQQGLVLFWEVAAGEWPTCAGVPCPHEETMLIQRAQIERLTA
jgi:hypothetical protein